MKFNLKEIFGVDLEDNETLRLAMAEALLNKMLDKTAASKDRSGDKFKKYSKSYKKSAAFKAAGKSNKVNLQLSGDMLALVEAVGETSNTVTLGWDGGNEGAKAHGHITGGGRLPVRDFFGLNDKDIAQVQKKFSTEIDLLKEAKGEERDDAVEAFISRLDGES